MLIIIWLLWLPLLSKTSHIAARLSGTCPRRRLWGGKFLKTSVYSAGVMNSAKMNPIPNNEEQPEHVTWHATFSFRAVVSYPWAELYRDHNIIIGGVPLYYSYNLLAFNSLGTRIRHVTTGKSYIRSGSKQTCLKCDQYCGHNILSMWTFRQIFEKSSGVQNLHTKPV